MSVNVNRSVSDQFYRYKMPRLIAKVNSLGLGCFDIESLRMVVDKFVLALPG